MKNHEETRKKVAQLFAAAKSFRASIEPDLREAERFYDGKHWKDNEKKPYKNFCWSTIQYELPLLTAEMPSAELVAHDEDRQTDTEMLDAAMQYTFEQQNMALKLPILIEECLKTTTSWLYVSYDPDAEKGEGSVKYKILPWRTVWIDPAATELSEAEHAHIHMPVSVEELKRRFPKYADIIKPENISETSFDGATVGDTTNEDHDYGYDGGETDSPYKNNNMALLKETWLKDYSMVKIPQEETVAELEKEENELSQGINPDVGQYEDHENHMANHEMQERNFVAQALGIELEDLTEEDRQNLIESEPEIGITLQIFRDHIETHEAMAELNPKGEKPKYVNFWRLVLMIGNTIVHNGSPDDGLDMIPLVPFYCYKGLSPYSTGELKNIIPINKTLNEMDYFEYSNLRLTGNSQKVVIKGSGIDPDDVTNEPGLVLEANPGFGDGISAIQPAQTSPQFAVRRGYDQESMQIISGINEATQGRPVTGYKAAEAYKAIAQQSIGRVRQKSRIMDGYSFKRLAELTTFFIVKRWSTERKLRIFDNDGEIKHVDYNPETISDLRYDIKVAPATMGNMDKQAMFDMFAGLRADGSIDARTFVNSVPDMPRRKMILEAIEESDEKNAMLEQQAAQIEELQMQLEQLINPSAQTPV